MMNKKLWPVFLLVVLGLNGLVSVVRAASEDASRSRSIEQLIVQLGDDQFLLRQQAEAELLSRGPAAFAELKAAERHADLEVASRAKYILNQISIDWVRADDLPIVQSIMARYGDLTFQARLKKVGDLSQLEHEQGFGALCRVARYESSGQIARYAALAILEKGFLPTARVAAAVDALNVEMGKVEPSGDSEGVPVAWVRTYAQQLQDSQQFDGRWLQQLDDELALLDEETGQTSAGLAMTYLRSYLEVCDHFSDAPAILAGMQRRIELRDPSDEVISARLVDALKWLVERQQWEALELLEDRYAETIKQDRLVLYHLAEAREKQGRTDAAEVLAQKALEFEVVDPIERNVLATRLSNLGRHDWAEREWQAVIDSTEPTELQSLLARDSMGLYRLHDRLEHQAAADLLSESLNAIEADLEVLGEYRNDADAWGDLTRAKSNRAFYLACACESNHDYDQQREHLAVAFKLEPANADIVIAMFNSPEASEEYHEKARQRVIATRKGLEKDIRQLLKMKDRDQAVAVYLAHKHNHWAWLVSNTEGDFKRAVKFSQRSLELQPGSASYLDTLGRCYYAAGDLENAIKVQREAIEKHPHLMVMQRQLKLFEDELQAKSADD